MLHFSYWEIKVLISMFGDIRLFSVKGLPQEHFSKGEVVVYSYCSPLSFVAKHAAINSKCSEALTLRIFLKRSKYA